jgi:hypothetical protein
MRAAKGTPAVSSASCSLPNSLLATSTAPILKRNDDICVAPVPNATAAPDNHERKEAVGGCILSLLPCESCG